MRYILSSSGIIDTKDGTESTVDEGILEDYFKFICIKCDDCAKDVYRKLCCLDDTYSVDKNMDLSTLSSDKLIEYTFNSSDKVKLYPMQTYGGGSVKMTLGKSSYAVLDLTKHKYDIKHFSPSYGKVCFPDKQFLNIDTFYVFSPVTFTGRLRNIGSLNINTNLPVFNSILSRTGYIGTVTGECLSVKSENAEIRLGAGVGYFDLHISVCVNTCKLIIDLGGYERSKRNKLLLTADRGIKGRKAERVDLVFRNCHPSNTGVPVTINVGVGYEFINCRKYIESAGGQLIEI